MMVTLSGRDTLTNGSFIDTCYRPTMNTQSKPRPGTEIVFGIIYFFLAVSVIIAVLIWWVQHQYNTSMSRMTPQIK